VEYECEYEYEYEHEYEYEYEFEYGTTSQYQHGDCLQQEFQVGGSGSRATRVISW